ncbi:MAG: hydroxysqualene dehydroxylase HpnE [Alphaproteobacteria bacterium]|nr:hydroxysqualene dehydroxylase HpnE [Alphaproteobacteria bacterium]
MTVAVIGAGLAGLAAALDLAEAGVAVQVFETSPHAGGRCRSWHDPDLGLIDNGAHILLTSNHTAMAWLARLGTAGLMQPVAAGGFVFRDLADGARWTVRPDRGPWVFDAKRRTADVGAWSHLSGLLRLLLAGRTATVTEVLRRQPLALRRLWQPLCVAALNTPPDLASARMFARTLMRAFATPPVPLLASQSLDAALVAPAVERLRALGGVVRTGCRVQRLIRQDARVTALVTAEGEVPVTAVVLAAPPEAAAELMPGLVVPTASAAIVNLHARLPEGVRLSEGPMLGLIGGTAEWLFQRGSLLTVTVSAADRLLALSRAEIAALVWRDCEVVLGCPLPAAHRVIKERRATILATPAGLSQRPSVDATGLSNARLAGDWTATPVPATIEGALISGARAARSLLQALPTLRLPVAVAAPT